MLSELDILITFFPLLFVSFDTLADLRKFLGWCAVILAIICNVYQVRLYLESPEWWLPVVSFLFAFVLALFQRRHFRGLTALGGLFIVQALMTKSLPVIVILLLFSDTFFCAEYFTSEDKEGRNQAMQSLFRALLSFLPAVAGILLKLPEEGMGVCVAATIILRLFSWPLSNWARDLGQNRKIYALCVGGVSSFILWRTQDVGHEPAWAFVWLATSVVLSLGCDLIELLPALALGLFAVSPLCALLSLCLWPLLVRTQTLQPLLVLVGATVGFLTFPVAMKVFVEQAAIPIAVLSAFALARAFAREPWQKNEWTFEGAAVLLSALIVGGLVFFFPVIFQLQEIPISGIVFSASLVVFYGASRLLIRTKEKFFKKISRISFEVPWVSRLQIKERETVEADVLVVPPPWLEKFLSWLDGESYLVLLLGFLGAFLIWGVR